MEFSNMILDLDVVVSHNSSFRVSCARSHRATGGFKRTQRKGKYIFTHPHLEIADAVPRRAYVGTLAKKQLH